MMEHRAHRRAPLRLPVRLRWSTPFGQLTEICETRDASRGGLLLHCSRNHAQGSSVWVAFPHDPSLADVQPEVPARVLRSGQLREPQTPTEPGGGVYFAALQYCMAATRKFNGNARDGRRDRRGAQRRAISMPVRIRGASALWPEEAMTTDVSEDGLRFLTPREYTPGQRVAVAFAPGAFVPWHSLPANVEAMARVVHVRNRPHAVLLEVSVERLFEHPHHPSGGRGTPLQS
jgi:hypothetical protein